MKTKLNLFQARVLCAMALGMGSSFSLAAAADAPDTAPAKTSEAIQWSQIGAKAGADYRGDGLAVIAAAEGARLRCAFQRLEGEATREGLWLTSTVIPPGGTVHDRFRLLATAVGRVTPCAPEAANRTSNIQPPTSNIQLEKTDTISLTGQTVRFTRPGLEEEYTVSMDGVRQDFVVRERPAGAGELMVRLAVSGAKIEPAAFGAGLVLENSGRKIAYSRLRVTDATGKELQAWMEVQCSADFQVCCIAGFQTRRPHDVQHHADLEIGETAGLETCATREPTALRRNGTLVVLVNDADAVYPLRIDPTFSDANWSSMNPGIPGADGDVLAAAVDGLGNLYIGGYFTVVGNVVANHVAKWNGSRWSVLGSGIDGQVYALAVSGSDVYAGGFFTTAGGTATTNIAKWDGSSWSALGPGVGGVYSPSVHALAISGSSLYVGGYFATAGGSTANNIAKWDGGSWSALGTGINYYVFALAVSAGDVYAAGDFTTAGGSAANRIAKWNGNNWTALGSGMNSTVYALAVSGSNVYAGGYFTTAGGSAANYIAKWDGSSWSALSSGMTGVDPVFRSFVSALALSGSDIYAGGAFTNAGGSPASSIAKWDGNRWSALGPGMGGGSPNYTCVSVLAASGSNVYAGGNFTATGGGATKYIAAWSGSNWSALSSGVDGLAVPYVDALAVSGSEVYVGGWLGTFATTADDREARYVAKWNGCNWAALGSGIGGGLDYTHVSALAVSGSDLYAGGYFTTATNSGGAGVTVNSIAKWNGTNWTALGSGVTGPFNAFVSALAVSGDDVYAGGYFTNAINSGGVPVTVKSIAKWNGTSWSELGSGIDGAVYTLAPAGGNLYAGGGFTTAGGSPAHNIAKWDGSSWSALGSGTAGGGELGPAVHALAVLGGDLYAGGSFTMVDGSPANRIAKWDGSTWSALGLGVNWNVSALAVWGNNLYAAGEFTTAGGIAANRIAKWDGTNWTALGSGISGPALYPYYGGHVSALIVSGSELYVGGYFTAAGGKVSAHIARAYLPPLPALSVLRSDADVMVSWPSADTTSFALEQAGTLDAPTNWVTNTASVSDDGTNRSVTLPATNSAQFFRLRGP